ncbi:MAG: hypothetical protein FJ291_20735 [Planctomycetes bacterium]|nr:hypothetical protein [Planctomycetota bacterium]
MRGALWLALAAATAAAQHELRTPQGVVYTITADGVSSIRLGQREVARGSWRADSGDWILNTGSGKIDAKVIQKKFVRADEDMVRVDHEHRDMKVCYVYSLEGDDLRILALVSSRHETRELGAVWFRGLTFDFAKPPAGLMFHQHGSYLRAHGVGLCHPSFASRIGGSYAVGDGFGVGLSPAGPTLERTLFWWDYTDWREGQREKLPTRDLSYLVAAPLPPVSMREFDMTLRVSTATGWKHLLEPYKRQFTAVCGEVQYKADHRVFAQACVNGAVSFIKPDNPYGFHGGFRRLDLAEGAKAFCDTLITGLAAARGQGVLIWGQGGENPRGAMYRPDFDILPPEVEANWPTLAARFKEAGLRLGVCARPGEIAYQANWKQDATLRINPDDPAHVQMMVRRFKNMTDKGCTAFYLDTFGSSLDDVKAMVAYRKTLGPDVATYVEHACDAVLPHSGVYTELHFDKKANAYILAFMSVHTWEIFRWLVPGVTCVVRSHVEPKDVPDGLEKPFPFMFRNHLTPLVADWLVKGHAAELKPLADEWLDDKGQWKK